MDKDDSLDCPLLDVAIIKEIYEEENSSERFEQELERALEAKYKTIIIEPSRLGDETARWILLGNTLHKTAVITGCVSLLVSASSDYWPDYCAYFSCPLGVVSVGCSAFYTVSWQTDPCCKYQVARDGISQLPGTLRELRTSTPVVLTRRDDTARKLLHTTVSLLATAVCGYKLCKAYYAT